MINSLIAILVAKKLFTEEEGRSMAEKMRLATLPADYASAQKQIQKFLHELEKGL